MSHFIAVYGEGTTECRETPVAWLRRTAFDPLNKMVYLALECEDLYGITNGMGRRRFTEGQLASALEFLDAENDPDSLAALPNPGSKVMDSMARWLPDVTVRVGRGDRREGVAREIEFLERCIEHLRLYGLDDIDISFS